MELKEVLLASMQFSEPCGEMLIAYSKARLEFKALVKTKQGYGYKYAGLDDDFEAIDSALGKYSIIPSQGFETRFTSGGITNGIKTVLMHCSGQFIANWTPLLPGGDGAQEYGSAATYARRYGLEALLGLAGEDDDGKKAQESSRPARESARATPAASSNPNDYVIPFGKNKGKRLSDLKDEEIESFMVWLRDKANKPLTDNAIEFMRQAEAYLFGKKPEMPASELVNITKELLQAPDEIPF
jgi:hypothetical protein